MTGGGGDMQPQPGVPPGGGQQFDEDDDDDEDESDESEDDDDENGDQIEGECDAAFCYCMVWHVTLAVFSAIFIRRSDFLWSTWRAFFFSSTV